MHHYTCEYAKEKITAAKRHVEMIECGLSENCNVRRSDDYKHHVHTLKVWCFQVKLKCLRPLKCICSVVVVASYAHHPSSLDMKTGLCR